MNEESALPAEGPINMYRFGSRLQSVTQPHTHTLKRDEINGMI